MSGGIEIRAQWKTAAVQALMRRLSPPRLHQALSVAVNDASRQVEREAERKVAATLSIPLKRAKTGIWVRPYSTPATLTAVVRGSGSPIPLKAFNAKETRPGVVASIWGEKRLYPGAFIKGGLFPKRVEIGLGGHVFERLGSSRLPIDKVPGAAIADAMTKDAVSDALVTIGQERMIANITRQLGRYSRSRR